MHKHTCETCGDEFTCDDALLERNHDGFPEVICRRWHEWGERQCESCWNAETEGADGRPCPDCGMESCIC